MPLYSDSLMLAWNIAAHEAAHGGYAMIESSHLFIGLAKLVDYPINELIGQATPEDAMCLARITVDVAELALLFNDTRIDVKQFRRRLRAELGGTVCPVKKPVMHRSQASRRVFELMEAFCDDYSVHTVRPVHLVWALSTIDGSPWDQVLCGLGVDQQTLKARSQMSGCITVSEDNCDITPRASGTAWCRSDE